MKSGRILAAALAIIMFLVLPSAVRAAKVKSWQHGSEADFEQGKLSGLVVTSTGEVMLGRNLEQVADLGAALGWQLARGADDTVYVVTGTPGQLLKIVAGQDPQVLWKHENTQAFALCAQPDGSLLVGTGPEGIVYRIDPQGEAKEFCRTGELYVWSLVAAEHGKSYAATGPHGKILAIDPDGKAEVFYETNQQHVLCLARQADGTLVAGTDGAGLVLAIDADGKGRALYDAEEDEVRTLAIDAAGTIYAGTAKGAGTADDAGKSSSQKAAANSVYRIGTDRGVRKVFGASALVYSLAQLDGTSGVMLAGTGTDGVLYTLDVDGRGENELARLDAELLLAMLPGQQQDLLVVTGNPGRLYRVSSDYAAEGTLTSEPLDAKLVARYGALSWRAAAPEGTQVALAVRSGNTTTPDDTWSTWSVESHDPAAAHAGCPAGRFLQYRVTLRTSDPTITPTLRTLTIRYLTTNQSPQITKLDVPHVEDGDGSKRLEKLKIAWAASDLNGDSLNYRLCCKKPDWQSWVTLVDSTTDDEYEWDITSMPEGVYQVRVVADDTDHNPPTEALTATLISEPFIVDRTGPTIEAQLVGIGSGRNATFAATVRDAHCPIVAASYSLDSGEWVNIFPEDQLFDSQAESLRFDVRELSPGTHVLVIRATDAAGYTGSNDLVFEATDPAVTALQE